MLGKSRSNFPKQKLAIVKMKSCEKCITKSKFDPCRILSAGALHSVLQRAIRTLKRRATVEITLDTHSSERFGVFLLFKRFLSLSIAFFMLSIDDEGLVETALGWKTATWIESTPQ
jgi:hypothetical protein